MFEAVSGLNSRIEELE
jgi:hypothetical protein